MEEPAAASKVYLIRHGIAAERGTYRDDNQRPLIEKGIDKTEKVAQRLVDFGIRFDTLLTSPLIRAIQTAQILCQADLVANYQIFHPLAPDGRIQDWLDWLTTWRQSPQHQTLGLVGHEPDLSTWAQLLVQGTNDGEWILKKAGIIGLMVPTPENAMGNSQLFWLAPPRLIL